MDIVFAQTRMKDEFNNQRKLQKNHGKVRAGKIIMRMTQLAAANCLEDLRHAPGRFHNLTADRDGQIACDLGHPYRLIFEPANEPKPSLPDGKGLDWQKVTRVRILEIEDYH